MRIKELLEKCGDENCEVVIFNFSTGKTEKFLNSNDAISKYGDCLVFSWTVEAKREIYIRIDRASEVSVNDYDPVLAKHMAADLACRLDLLECENMEELESLISCAWSIVHLLEQPNEREG